SRSIKIDPDKQEDYESDSWQHEEVEEVATAGLHNKVVDNANMQQQKRRQRSEIHKRTQRANFSQEDKTKDNRYTSHKECARIRRLIFWMDPCKNMRQYSIAPHAVQQTRDCRLCNKCIGDSPGQHCR